VIAAQEATELFAAVTGSGGWRAVEFRWDDPVVQALMDSFPMIVIDELIANHTNGLP
jgi:hypothetical protein